MKNIKYNYPKSSFLNVEKDLGIIIDKILQNDRLQKLLYWNHKDALTRRKLTDDEKFSLIEKENQWLLCNGDDEIIWIIGQRADDRFKITDRTTEILKITSLHA